MDGYGWDICEYNIPQDRSGYHIYPLHIQTPHHLAFSHAYLFGTSAKRKVKAFTMVDNDQS